MRRQGVCQMGHSYILYHTRLKNMSSYESMNVRLKELTGQLDQKDTELDQEVDDIIETD